MSSATQDPSPAFEFSPPGLEIHPRFNLNTAEAIDSEWQNFGLTPIEEEPFLPFGNRESEEVFETPLQTYYREREEDDMRMNHSLTSEPSSASLKSSQSPSDWILSDWLQSSLCSVKSEDVPLSEITVLENEFENSFYEFDLSNTSLNPEEESLLDQSVGPEVEPNKPEVGSDEPEINPLKRVSSKSLRVDSFALEVDPNERPHGKPVKPEVNLIAEADKLLGPDVSFDFGRNPSQENISDRDLDKTEEVAVDDPTCDDTVILYSQDKVDPFNPAQTQDSIHLSEEDFGKFVPLTFNTSIDLRQKLRVQNIIPPSQLPTDSQLSFTAEKVMKGKRAADESRGDHNVPTQSLAREEDSHEPTENLFYDRSSTTFHHENPKRQKLSTEETSNSKNGQASDQNGGTQSSLSPNLSEPDNVTLSTRERQQLQSSSFNFGLSEVTAPNLLNRAPRIGLSRLTRVKPLHKFNQS